MFVSCDEKERERTCGEREKWRKNEKEREWGGGGMSEGEIGGEER